ncbi:MAG: hypothetical protein AAFU85_12550 [Planctomycetota bacterium]
MFQFKLRSILLLVSVTAMLLASWRYAPFQTAAVTVLLGSIVSRVGAARVISSTFVLWVVASAGAAAAMIFCLVVEFLVLEYQQRPVHIGWGRAIPMSLVVGIAVGSVVSAVHGVILRFSPLQRGVQ